MDALVSSGQCVWPGLEFWGAHCWEPVASIYYLIHVWYPLLCHHFRQNPPNGTPRGLDVIGAEEFRSLFRVERGKWSMCSSSKDASSLRQHTGTSPLRSPQEEGSFWCVIMCQYIWTHCRKWQNYPHLGTAWAVSCWPKVKLPGPRNFFFSLQLPVRRPWVLWHNCYLTPPLSKKKRKDSDDSLSYTW